MYDIESKFIYQSACEYKTIIININYTDLKISLFCAYCN